MQARPDEAELWDLGTDPPGSLSSCQVTGSPGAQGAAPSSSPLRQPHLGSIHSTTEISRSLQGGRGISSCGRETSFISSVTSRSVLRTPGLREGMLKNIWLVLWSNAGGRKHPELLNYGTPLRNRCYVTVKAQPQSCRVPVPDVCPHFSRHPTIQRIHRASC